MLDLERRPVDRPPVQPGRGAGLEPAHLQGPTREASRERPIDGASPTRPAGIFRSPMWIRPGEEGARSSARPRRPRAPCPRPSVRRRPARPSGSGPRRRLPMTVRLAMPAIASCIARLIELAVGLGPRPSDRRSLAPVEQPELDSGLVGHPAHQAVERVDLPDQVALAQTRRWPDCRTSRRWCRGGG